MDAEGEAVRPNEAKEHLFPEDRPLDPVTGKELIATWPLCMWAFGDEKAVLDRDDRPLCRPSFGTEYLILQRGALGGVAIDTSPGRSLPHEDAQMVASLVQSVLPWGQARLIADCARRMTPPDWKPNPQPTCQPVAWRGSKNGRYAQTEVWRGRDRWYPVGCRKFGRACPVTYTDTADEIKAERGVYLDWIGGLIKLRKAFRPILWSKYCLTQHLPPPRPWKNSLTSFPNA
ncbi:MAG: hypothetical protein QNJ44_22715 [Rhodobacter sp.]|nr:hypothetical protein [Rhodobacter sp.]